MLLKELTNARVSRKSIVMDLFIPRKLLEWPFIVSDCCAEKFFFARKSISLTVLSTLACSVKKFYCKFYVVCTYLPPKNLMAQHDSIPKYSVWFASILNSLKRNIFWEIKIILLHTKIQKFIENISCSLSVSLCVWASERERETDRQSSVSRVYYPEISCPIGWGCRIHQLHLWRGVSPPPTTSVQDMTVNNLMVKLQ